MKRAVRVQAMIQHMLAGILSHGKYRSVVIMRNGPR